MGQGFDPAVPCTLEPCSQAAPGCHHSTINTFDYGGLISVHLCHGWLGTPPCRALVLQWLIAPALDKLVSWGNYTWCCRLWVSQACHHQSSTRDVSHNMMHSESFLMGHSGASVWMPCSLDCHEEGPSQALSCQAPQRDADLLLLVPVTDLTSCVEG